MNHMIDNMVLKSIRFYYYFFLYLENRTFQVLVMSCENYC